MHQVEIHVAGHLDKQWAEWLDGFSMTHIDAGETILAGPVRDQSAMYGLIAKLRDLGVTLISVDCKAQTSQSCEQSSRSIRES